MFKKLWNDEVGAVISSELVLVTTILVIGMITGLATLRDAVVTELADVGAAISNLDQSFTIGAICAHSSATVGGSFFDGIDFCDTSCSPLNSGTRCLTIAAAGCITGSDNGAGLGAMGHSQGH